MTLHKSTISVRRTSMTIQFIQVTFRVSFQWRWHPWSHSSVGASSCLFVVPRPRHILQILRIESRRRNRPHITGISAIGITRLMIRRTISMWSSNNTGKPQWSIHTLDFISGSVIVCDICKNRHMHAVGTGPLMTTPEATRSPRSHMSCQITTPRTTTEEQYNRINDKFNVYIIESGQTYLVVFQC